MWRELVNALRIVSDYRRVLMRACVRVTLRSAAHLDDRAVLVKLVELLRGLEEVVAELVGVELRFEPFEHFRKLEQLFGERDLTMSGPLAASEFDREGVSTRAQARRVETTRL